MNRRYALIAKNDRTGETTRLSQSADLTHAEACEMKKRFSTYPGRTIMLLDTTYPQEGTMNDHTQENQQTITEWSDSTFGYKHPLVVAARMNIEVSELLIELAKCSYEPGTAPDIEELLQANHALADAICELVNEPTVPVGAMDEAELHPVRLECADVLIILSQVAQKVGGRLGLLVDHKMSINRNRIWAKVGGRFQHVKQETGE